MSSTNRAPTTPTEEAWKLMGDLVLDNARRREVTATVGMSFGRLRALRRIARHPRTMGELASMLGVDPPNLTPIVDALEQDGLVERQPHPTDRRAKLVVATRRGREQAKKADEILERPPAGLTGLTAEEVGTLVALLQRIHDAVPPGD
jgi:DNA-binding MarR family transcriptional regulator